MFESKPQAQNEKFFDIVDLRRVRIPSRSAGDREPKQLLKQFFRKLGFYVDGSAMASKIYEKKVGGCTHRLFVEVYNAEGYYTAILALNTRDVEELKQVVHVMNTVLEREARARGYERAV